jgi:predicted nucleic acid-binding protein
MPLEKIVVSDTSPLIGLAHLGLLTIPKMLRGKLYIPNAVFAEVLRKSPGREEVQRAVSDGWKKYLMWELKTWKVTHWKKITGSWKLSARELC